MWSMPIMFSVHVNDIIFVMTYIYFNYNTLINEITTMQCRPFFGRQNPAHIRWKRSSLERYHYYIVIDSHLCKNISGRLLSIILHYSVASACLQFGTYSYWKT